MNQIHAGGNKKHRQAVWLLINIAKLQLWTIPSLHIVLEDDAVLSITHIFLHEIHPFSYLQISPQYIQQ